MKRFVFVLFALLAVHSLFPQADRAKFYLGASYGTSFPMGDFNDDDITNPDAGFADNGTKLDFYGGYFLEDNITLTGTLRYQSFDTEIGAIIDELNEANPSADFSGSTEDWQVYYFLAGVAYQVNIAKNFAILPRMALGPMLVTTPGINVNAPEGPITQNFSRSSETGLGLGYEFGISLRRDLGKRFTLLPTFSFSGGIATINDVVTTTDNVEITGDYNPRVMSFTQGVSLAYRFY